MQRLLFAAGLLAVFAIAGCTTVNPASAYVPAKSIAGTGYFERPISLSQYQVSFRGTPGLSKKTVEELAMLRAAEFSQEKGRTWFKVIRRDTAELNVPRKKNYAMSTSSQNVTCSQQKGGCSYNQSLTSVGGADVGSSSGFDTIYACVLQIELGEGAMPQGANVMNAKATAQKLRASVLTPKS